MLQNAYLLAKIGVDTAENERIFAEKLPKKRFAPGRGGGTARLDVKGTPRLLPEAIQVNVLKPDIMRMSENFPLFFSEKCYQHSIEHLINPAFFLEPLS